MSIDLTVKQNTNTLKVTITQTSLTATVFKQVDINGDGSTLNFSVDGTDTMIANSQIVVVNGFIRFVGTHYTVDGDLKGITFVGGEAPKAGWKGILYYATT